MQNPSRCSNVITQFGFTYDASGDISEETTSPLPELVEGLEGLLSLPEMSYGPGNRLATYNGEAVQFDADGNMTHGPLNDTMDDFVYDSRRRLTQAGTTQYVYDAENNRIGVNGTRFVVNSQPALSQVLVKTAADGGQTFYVYGLGLIGEESAAGYKAYHFDFRGSTVALTDTAGAVLERFRYSAYGVLLAGNVSVTPFLFNGMYGVMTDGNGLYYMRARFYSAEIRRFLNRDVVLGDVAEGQSLNRFGFVKGNPINYLDPFGLEEFQPGSLTDMIPIYGPRNLAVYYFNNGEAGWGIFYTTVSVSDVFLIRALVTSSIRLCASETIIGRSVGAAFARMTPGGRELTEHALESLERHGFRNLEQVDNIIDNYTRLAEQADGAIVYIQKNFRGRYDIIVEGAEGITTGMLNLSRHELQNLARNYGW